MNTKILFAIPFVVILILSGCKLAADTGKVQIPANEQEQQLIGGQRDDHGCLGPAGYSWNEEIGACARQWELDESQKQAAKIAVAKIGQTDGLTVVEVLAKEGTDSFDVKFDTYQEQTVVQIRDGKAE